MRGFIGLTNRNLKVFFKDKSTVFFSMLTSIIVLILYVVFLKGTFVDEIAEYTTNLESFITGDDIELIVSMILVTGIIGSAMVTVSFNCLQTIIKDREQHVDYDIAATPIKRWQIALSYFCSASISSIILTSVVLTAALIIIGSGLDLHMELIDFVKAYGLVIAGSISATATFMTIALLFKSVSAAGAFSGLLSAAMGFIIGAYIPLASFSENVQTVCHLFPATQITVLLRNVLIGGALNSIDEKIGGLDGGAFVNGIKQSFSFNSVIGGNTMEISAMITYIAVFFAVSLALMVVVFCKSYKRN